MKEVWLRVPNHNNYIVSNLGRLFSCRSNRILKLYTGNRGYVVVRQFLLHLFVLETFIGKRPNGMECNHKDGVKTNNRLDNLEWVTPIKNMLHAKENGLLKPAKGEKHGNSKITQNDVNKIRELYKTNNYSMRKLAVKFNIHNSTVWQIINEKTWRP